MDIKFLGYDEDFRYNQLCSVPITSEYHIKFSSLLLNPDEYVNGVGATIYSEISLIRDYDNQTFIVSTEQFKDIFHTTGYDEIKSFYENRITEKYYELISSHQIFDINTVGGLLKHKGVLEFLLDESREIDAVSFIIGNTYFVFAKREYHKLYIESDYYKIREFVLDEDLDIIKEYILNILINKKNEIMKENEIKNDVTEVEGFPIVKNKVTQEDVDNEIAAIQVKTLDDFGKPTTYVAVILKNGFTMREATTCVDPDNYDEAIGAEICLKRIKDKIWFLLGYKLQEEIYNANDIDTDECESTRAVAVGEKSDDITSDTCFPPYVQRMFNEQKELSERINKLDAFVNGNNDIFNNLPDKEKELMNKQFEYMKMYHNVLCERIDSAVYEFTGNK